MKGALAAVLGVISACASEGDQELMPGFAPPPPSAGEIQYRSPIVRSIQPGEDRIVCSYLDAYVDQDFDVANVAGYSTTGSHHVSLYASSFVQTPNTHDCRDEEMVYFSFVGDGGETPSTVLPDGLVRRVRRGSQLLIQTHWFNASDEPLDGQAVFNVRYESAAPDKTPTDFMAVMSTSFEVTPGTSRTSVTCTVGDTLSVWQLAGHQHDLGKHVRVLFEPKDGEQQLLIDEDWKQEWSFNPRFMSFTPGPMLMRPGDKVTVECEWENPGQDTLRFPSEMCGALGQVFPSSARLVCLNGDWIGG